MASCFPDHCASPKEDGLHDLHRLPAELCCPDPAVPAVPNSLSSRAPFSECHFPALVPDIDGGIDIPVMLRPAGRTLPLPYPDVFYFRVLLPAAVADLGGSIILRDFDDTPAFSCRFVP